MTFMERIKDQIGECIVCGEEVFKSDLEVDPADINAAIELGMKDAYVHRRCFPGRWSGSISATWKEEGNGPSE